MNHRQKNRQNKLVMFENEKNMSPEIQTNKYYQLIWFTAVTTSSLQYNNQSVLYLSNPAAHHYISQNKAELCSDIKFDCMRIKGSAGNSWNMKYFII